MAQGLNKTKDFNFKQLDTQWGGYVSSADKTKLAPNLMVGGSQNVYKNIAGNLSVRPGLKQYSPIDTAIAPVNSEYVWYKSNGSVFPMQVANSKLQVLINSIWYTLQTGITNTRYVFDKWYSSIQNHDYLAMVNGTQGIFYLWGGGYTTILRGNNTSIALAGQVGLTGTTTMTGTATTKVIPYFNSSTGNSFVGSLVGVTNPANGETLLYTVQGVGPITITFVSVIGAVAGNVLIGANIGATMTNLLGLLNAPGTTSATQVALSAPNQAAVANVNYTATNTITKNGTTTWQQEGFTNTSTAYSSNMVIINGTTYTYSRLSAGTLTLNGVTPDPSGEALNSVAIQTLITVDELALFGTFVPDFCKTIENQLYLGSYSSQLCYVSSSIDVTNFTTVSPALQGSPNLIVFDSTLKGIAVKSGKPCMGVGTGRWGVVNYSYQNLNNINVRQTNIEYTPVGSLVAPLAHEFIDSSGDNIIYFSQDQQVRTFGNFNNSFTSNNYPVLSQEIYTELQEQTFSTTNIVGSLKVISDKLYLTNPNTGQVYVREDRQAISNTGQTINEQIWFAPMQWNATRMDEISGTVVAFSNANPDIYEVWDTNQWYDDSPSGESLPYECVAALSYRNLGKFTLNEFDKIATEGYITPGTPLQVQINYNYLGVEGTLTQYVNSSTYPATYFAIDPDSLGDSSFGDDSLGSGGDEDSDGLVKFDTINQFSLINNLEFQPIYSSSEINSRWELESVGTNATVCDTQQLGFIINKQ